MGLLFSNYAEEGYYEYNDYDGYTKIENIDTIHELKKEGRLYRHDGMGMGKVNEDEEININSKYED